MELSPKIFDNMKKLNLIKLLGVIALHVKKIKMEAVLMLR